MISRLIAVFSLLSSMLVGSIRTVPDRGCAPAAWLDVGARVLACDLAAGLVTLAFGDPRTTRNIAVLVPGVGVDRAHVGAPTDVHAPLGWAAALHAATNDRANDRANDTAVVLWVGYRTPSPIGFRALTGAAARDGAATLPAFLDALRRDRPDPVHLSVIGHSYGAVTVALAAARLGLRRTDDVLLVASPGARTGTVAGLDTAARVWAGRSPADWVRLVPPLQLGDLGHGPDPAAAAFGARPLDVADAPAHDRYFDPGSGALAAIAAVVGPRRTPELQQSHFPAITLRQSGFAAT